MSSCLRLIQHQGWVSYGDILVNSKCQSRAPNPKPGDQVLTRELPGVFLEQPAQSQGSGMGVPGLGVCFCGAGGRGYGISTHHLAPQPSQDMGEVSLGVKPGCLPLCYSVGLPSHHLHCLLLLPPSMGAPGLGDLG